MNKILFLVLFICTSLVVFSQGPGDDPDFPDIPLDGGLGLLLVAGAAYGGKKVVEYRKGRNMKK